MGNMHIMKEIVGKQTHDNWSNLFYLYMEEGEI